MSDSPTPSPAPNSDPNHDVNADGADTESTRRDFIREIIDEHNRAGRFGGAVYTRFPPEPNGYLHIGHAKSICLNFAIASDYNGKCNLRFDDTNPAKEEDEYVRSIVEDVRWLGFQWEGDIRFASDYFEQMYAFAVKLIDKGVAYVDDQTPEEIRENRGTLTSPGKDSPFRDRSVDENLDLFSRMRNGEFPDGSKVLRAKIDMRSPNLNLRDPIMYRILRAHHHRTGDTWCIYPMYDWAHGLEDSIEGITHSICTLEFENHRPLYDWFLRQLDVHHPQQIEFARLNLNYTIMSKRKLRSLVTEKHVNGWDDPRMPTISGMRRRGYPPEAIRTFCARIGVAKNDSTIDVALLEHTIREYLNQHAPRVMAVLRPLKVVITNWGEHGDPDRVEWMDAINNPEDESAGSRKVPFSGTLYIERDDFLEDPPRKFFRLGPGREVRLRYGYWVKCHDFKKDAAGNVTELHCTYDPETRGGDAPPDGRKVKGTLHWVSAEHAIEAEVRLFDRLFNVEQPGKASGEFLDDLNPNSLEVIERALVEPHLASDEAQLTPGTCLQFERLGYFCLDPESNTRENTADSTTKRLIFNRTVTLKDAWAKIQAKGG